MINSQNIIIISHPRSGSYWFQECLYNHYNMDELFNIRNISEVFLTNKKLVVSPYTENIKLPSQKKQHRKKLFDKVKQNKVVKIHYCHLDKWVKNWLLKQENLSIIFLERKDKEQAFKSLLIANHLKKFVGELPSLKIEIDLNTVQECYDAIFAIDDFINTIKHKFSNLHFYYEDALKLEKNDWFDSNAVKIKKQNSTKVVEIKNYKEVKEFLKSKNLNVSNRRIF